MCKTPRATALLACLCAATSCVSVDTLSPAAHAAAGRLLAFAPAGLGPHGGLGLLGGGAARWEHDPVAEDCSLCHRPHGSVNDRLMTTRGPASCQQCHAAAFHPSVPYGSEGLPSGSANQNLLGKNCLNCHSQIHGSNHPSGARLTR